MICSKCGADVDKTYRFCPYCGNPISGGDVLPSSSEHSHEGQNKTVRKVMPGWFKALILIALIALIGVTAGILFTESLVDVIDKQLEALHKNEINNAYYAYTSSEFQRTTSLEDFKEFVEAHPIFFNSQSAHFIQRSIKQGVGTIKGNLTSADRVKVSIEYKLIKEEGKWKILSIRLLGSEGSKPMDKESQAPLKELEGIVSGQLNAIKEGKVDEAYEKYSSAEFKTATSLKDFQDFVQRYPELTNYDYITISKSTARKGGGIVSVTLFHGEVPAYVKYYFIFENEAWKIWSMRILSPFEEGAALKASENNDNGHSELSNIKIGTLVDAKGMIQNPSNRFKANSGNIYVNIDILNGVQGESIQLDFRHLESHTSILAKTTIEEEGDSNLISVFAPPVGGWLKGTYQLVVSTSMGTSQSVDFTME